VGNRVFGFRDSPFQSLQPGSVSFLAPTDLIRSSPRVSIKRLLWGPRFTAEGDIALSPAATIDKAMLVSQSHVGMVLELIGGGLGGLTPVFPDDIKLVTQGDTGAMLTIAAAVAKDLRQIVLKGKFGEVLLVAMPTESASSGPTLQAAAPIKAGVTTAITVAGSGLDNLDHVEYKGATLKSTLSVDRKSVRIDLPASVMNEAGTANLQFVFKKFDSVSYPLSIFDTKVDIPQAPAK
jgi:hypothetical protein